MTAITFRKFAEMPEAVGQRAGLDADVSLPQPLAHQPQPLQAQIAVQAHAAMFQNRAVKRADGYADLAGEILAVDRISETGRDDLFGLPHDLHEPACMRRPERLGADPVGEGIIDSGQHRFPDPVRGAGHGQLVGRGGREVHHFQNESAQLLLGVHRHFEHQEILTGLGPAPVEHLRREHHRGEMQRSAFDGRIAAAAPPDRQKRHVGVDSVHPQRIPRRHRKPDGGATGLQPHIHHARKRGDEIDVAARQIQDRLAGRDVPCQRREPDVDGPDGLPEFVDIIESKHTQGRRG